MWTRAVYVATTLEPCLRAGKVHCLVYYNWIQQMNLLQNLSVANNLAERVSPKSLLDLWLAVTDPVLCGTSTGNHCCCDIMTDGHVMLWRQHFAALLHIFQIFQFFVLYFQQCSLSLKGVGCINVLLIANSSTIILGRKESLQSLLFMIKRSFLG